MAMNWQTFRVRTLSALLFVAVMLIGLLWNEWSFLILFSIVHAACWIEYQKLISLIDEQYSKTHFIHRIGMVVAGWGMMLFFCGNWKLSDSYSLALIGEIILITGLILVFAFEIKELIQGRFKNLLYSIAGFIYLSVSFGMLMHIRSGAVSLANSEMDESVLPLLVIGSIWINDTMAYIVGSFIGKTPLSKVSPKKTWEGTIGGIILSVIAAWLTGQYLFESAGWFWGWIAALTAIAGTAGDLLESKLKRLAGVKDSGNILPGHGGFLDRFDSLLLAVPAVWLYLFISGLF
jgi:phosphatidate cytidylyltransferase